MSAKAPAWGHASKHVKTSKASKKTAKHSPTAAKKPVTSKAAGAKVHTAAKGAKASKPAGFAVGDLLPVCSFEAVAQSLRLAGQFVHDDEVAHLWELCGSPALGASVAAALDTASLYGVAGLRPQFERLTGIGVRAADQLALPLTEDEAVPAGPFEDFLAGNFHGSLPFGAGCRPSRIEDVTGAAAPVVVRPEPYDLEGASACAVRLDLSVPVVGGPEEYPVITAAARKHALYGQSGHAGVEPGAPRGECLSSHGLILRIDQPGPHAVLATADGWWSWGELCSPWPARVSEAWAVSWS